MTEHTNHDTLDDLDETLDRAVDECEQEALLDVIDHYREVALSSERSRYVPFSRWKKRWHNDQ